MFRKEDSTVVFGGKRRNLGRKSQQQRSHVQFPLRGEGCEQAPRSPPEALIMKLMVSLGLFIHC